MSINSVVPNNSGIVELTNDELVEIDGGFTFWSWGFVMFGEFYGIYFGTD